MIKVRKGIKKFADAMETKMQENDSEKGDSWKTCDIWFLFKKLGEETGEVAELIKDWEVKTEKLRGELADMSNISMMLWNRLGDLNRKNKERRAD